MIGKENGRKMVSLVLAMILLMDLMPIDTFLIQGMRGSPYVSASGEAAAEPSTEPAVVLTDEPAAEPTAVPAVEPTAESTVVLTAEPTAVPTAEQTAVPTAEPTAVPTAEPATVPTVTPAAESSAEPTVVLTAEPTVIPTAIPTAEPAVAPENTSAAEPSIEPTVAPTAEPGSEMPPPLPSDALIDQGYAFVLQNEVPVLEKAIAGSQAVAYLSKDDVVFVSKRITDAGHPGSGWMLCHFDTTQGILEGYVRERYLCFASESELEPLAKKIAGSGSGKSYNGHPLMLLDCGIVSEEIISTIEPPAAAAPETSSGPAIEPTAQPTADPAGTEEPTATPEVSETPSLQFAPFLQSGADEGMAGLSVLTSEFTHTLFVLKSNSNYSLLRPYLLNVPAGSTAGALLSNFENDPELETIWINDQPYDPGTVISPGTVIDLVGNEEFLDELVVCGSSDGFLYILDPSGKAKVVGYTGTADSLAFPASLNGHSVSAIADYFSSFANGSVLSISIPAGITAAGSNAFAGFAGSLTDITVWGMDTDISASGIGGSVIVHGLEGSAAQAFAAGSGNPFEAVSLPSVAVTSIEMEDEYVLLVGETASLQVQCLPDNAANKVLAWSSDDSGVAQVDQHTGLIMAVSAGTATVTAAATDGSGVYASCLVTVNPLSAVISLNKEGSVEAGQEIVASWSVISGRAPYAVYCYWQGLDEDGNTFTIYLGKADGMQGEARYVPTYGSSIHFLLSVQEHSNGVSVDFKSGELTILNAADSLDGSITLSEGIVDENSAAGIAADVSQAELLTASWSVSGTLEAYRITSAWRIWEAEDSEEFYIEGHEEYPAGTSGGTVSYTPTYGVKGQLTVNLFNEETGFSTQFASDVFRIVNGQEPISCAITLSNPHSVAVNHEQMATWSITGGCPPYEVFYDWYGVDAAGNNFWYSDFSNEAQSSTTFIPTYGKSAFFAVSVNDAAGAYRYFTSNDFLITGAPQALSCTFELSDTEVDVSSGESVSASWSITGSTAGFTFSSMFEITDSAWESSFVEELSSVAASGTQTYKPSFGVRGQLIVCVQNDRGLYMEFRSQEFTIINGAESFGCNLALSKDIVDVSQRESVNATWSITGGQEPLDIRYTWLFLDKNGAWCQQIDGETDQREGEASCTPTIGRSGRFELNVTDANGMSRSFIECFTLVNSPDPMACEFTFDKTEVDISAGEQITGTWNVTGGPEEYSIVEYWWEIQDTPSGPWYKVSAETETSASGSAGYHPIIGAKGRLVIRVTDINGLVNIFRSNAFSIAGSPDPLNCTIYLSKTSADVSLGESLTAQWSITGGVEPLAVRYCWVILDDNGNWLTQVDGTPDQRTGETTYAPRYGSYGYFHIYVTDASGIERNFHQQFSILNAPDLFDCTITLDKTAAAVGEAVTVEWAFTGGTAPYTVEEYGWNIMEADGRWYGDGWNNTPAAENSATYVPLYGTKGTFSLRVRDASGFSRNFTSDEFTITGAGDPLSCTISLGISGTVAVGMEQTASWSVTGGQAPYTVGYGWSILENGTWYGTGSSQTSASEGSAAFTPLNGTKGMLYLNVTDARGVSHGFSSAEFAITGAQEPLACTISLFNGEAPLAPGAQVAVGETVTAEWTFSQSDDRYTLENCYWEIHEADGKSYGEGWRNGAGTAGTASYTLMYGTRGAIVLSVRDVSGILRSFRSEEFTITGAGDPLACAITLSSPGAIAAGTEQTASWSITGGQAPYTICYWWNIQENGNWYGTNSSQVSAAEDNAAFTPRTGAKGRLYLDVTDARGVSRGFNSAEFAITGAPDPLACDIILTSGGEPVTAASQVAVGETVTAEWAFSQSEDQYTIDNFYWDIHEADGTGYGEGWSNNLAGTAGASSYNLMYGTRGAFSLTVRDASGILRSFRSEEFTITGAGDPLACTITLGTPGAVAAGTTQTASWSVTGGRAPYAISYWWNIQESGNWYGTNSSQTSAAAQGNAAFTPRTGDKGMLYLYVTDARGVSRGFSSAEFTITGAPGPLACNIELTSGGMPVTAASQVAVGETVTAEWTFGGSILPYTVESCYWDIQENNGMGYGEGWSNALGTAGTASYILKYGTKGVFVLSVRDASGILRNFRSEAFTITGAGEPLACTITLGTPGAVAAGTEQTASWTITGGQAPYTVGYGWNIQENGNWYGAAYSQAGEGISTAAYVPKAGARGMLNLNVTDHRGVSRGFLSPEFAITGSPAPLTCAISLFSGETPLMAGAQIMAGETVTAEWSIDNGIPPYAVSYWWNIEDNGYSYGAAYGSTDQSSGMPSYTASFGTKGKLYLSVLDATGVTRWFSSDEFVIAGAADAGDFVMNGGTVVRYTGDSADAVIPPFINGAMVTEIGSEAFSGSPVTSVRIPGSVSMISSTAFAGCMSLNAIHVAQDNAYFASADGVLFNEGRSILLAYPAGRSGSYAVPGGTAEIGAHAFEGCGLNGIVLPNTIITIGESAFKGMAGLASVTIPNGVSGNLSVGASAFSGCAGLTAVLLPDHVSQIGPCAFEGCTALDAISIADGNAFYASADGVLFNREKTILIAYPPAKPDMSYQIPPSVTAIEAGAFSDCVSIASLMIHEQVTNIAGTAVTGFAPVITGYAGSMAESYAALKGLVFTGLDTAAGSFTYTSDTAVTITGYAGTDTDVVIPAVIDGLPVIRLGGDAFASAGSVVTSIRIPASVVTIDSGAFKNCTALQTIDVAPSNGSFTSRSGVLYTADGHALLAYPAQKAGGSFAVPGDVSSIEAYAFAQCASLTTLFVPLSVNYLHADAFYGCGKMKVLGETGGVLQDYAQGNGQVLIILYSINSGSMTITRYASTLTNITLPSTLVVNGSTYPVAAVGSGAFSGCGSLAALVLPGSLTSVQPDSFPEGVAIVAPEGSATEAALINAGISYTSSVQITVDNDAGFMRAQTFGMAVGYAGAMTLDSSETGVIPDADKQINVGETVRLRVELPGEAPVAWESSDDGIASVVSVSSLEPGVYLAEATGHKAGRAFITVVQNGVYLGSFTLDVSQPVTSIELPAAYTLYTYETADTGALTAVIHPSDATDKSIVWYSDNEAVVTVSQGNPCVLTPAVSSGSATVYARTTNGSISASCTVTVSKKKFAISFDANGGTKVAPVTKAYGEPVDSSDVQETVRAGYAFEGWIPAVPENMPPADMTCAAQWSVNAYTMTFDSTGGTEAASITQDYGTSVTVPSDPAKEGYVFSGWSPAIPATMPAANKTYKAQWTPVQYTITFDEDGGSLMEDITAVYGADITAPANPSREGYAFKGWDKTLPPKMPLNGMKLKASWDINKYTVAFLNWNDQELKKETVIYGRGATAPTAVRAATAQYTYTFSGWDKEYANVTSNLTVRAQFRQTVNSYLVTFKDWDGRTLGTPQMVEYGKAAEAPANPARQGTAAYTFSFNGWDKAYDNITGDITVTALYLQSAAQHTITFDSGEGSEVSAITQDYGTAVTPPAEPAREGYTFAGWVPAVPETMPASDMTCVAQWTVVKYTITFDSAEGSEVSAITQDYGTAVTAPADPTRDGYTFTGWVPAVPETMPASDMTCVAQWTVNEETSVTLNEYSVLLYTAQTTSLTATVTPESASEKGVTWSSSDSGIATVSELGLVTAIKAGMATITAAAKDGSGKHACCTVTVSQYVLGITLNKTNAIVNIGEAITLAATIVPADATNKAIHWSSSNTSVATVSASGTVTGTQPGEATITAAASDGSGVKAACAITVVRPVTGITLNKTSATIAAGGTLALSATVSPSNASNKTVTWISSNTSVAKVSTGGSVTGVRPGTATITAAASDGSGIKAACAITVVQPVTGITLNKTSATIAVGGTLALSATVLPSNASNKTVTWSSSNTSVAKVSTGGSVTGIRPGTAIITAMASGGINAKCTVTVIKPVTQITLNLTRLTIGAGQSVSTVTATVSPSDATNKEIVWASKSPTVAAVDLKGKITGVKVGTATITATAADGSGKTAYVTVTVVPKGMGVTAIKLSQTSATVYEKATLTLKATLTPSTATNKTVVWSSSNTAVAKVSSTGVVTGVGKGTAAITAVSSSGIAAKCSITVAEVPVSSLKMSRTAVTMLVGATYQLTAIVSPSNAKNKTLTWSSSNTKVATVSLSGKVTATGAGKVTITAASVNGKKATCTVTVNPIKVTKVTIKPSTVKIAIAKGESLGKKITLQADVTPSNATVKKLKWTSSNTKAVTVDQNGVVTSRGYGTATITAASTDGSSKKASCTVTVSPVLVSSLKVTGAATMTAGGRQKLVLTVLPANALNPKVTWKSSDIKVAKIDTAGNVTALAKGTVTITAAAADGSKKTASFKITVK